MAGDHQHQQLGFEFAFDNSGDSASPSAADDYRRAAEQGDSKAQLQLAQLYRFGAARVARDRVEARIWYEASAANGNSVARRSGSAVEEQMLPDELTVAAFRIGELYLNGECAPQDYEAAFAWFRRAAASGHRDAQLRVGAMHRAGKGCRASPGRAFAWFCVALRQNSLEARRFADELRAGMTEAQVLSAWSKLGEMHRNGTEVPSDPEEALFWYRKAAEQGSAEAEFAIGEMCRNGEGVSADDRKALAWFCKAANRGLAKAQLEVGEMYLAGEGVPRRPVDGLAWLLVAARGGLDGAEWSKRNAENNLTATEVKKARMLSSEYHARITMSRSNESDS